MECSLIHLIFVIIFAPIVHGFSVSKVNVKLLQPKGIQFSLQGFVSAINLKLMLIKIRV